PERAVAERAADGHDHAHRNPDRHADQQRRELKPQPVKPEESIGRCSVAGKTPIAPASARSGYA
ncbi:MAG TPA: hypothetical protein VE888_22650, partial [Streptosporangiaceae bacterium]|nr:hypothetical protein [Streptosporangiaceae bacterium]